MRDAKPITDFTDTMYEQIAQWLYAAIHALLSLYGYETVSLFYPALGLAFIVSILALFGWIWSLLAQSKPKWAEYDPESPIWTEKREKPANCTCSCWDLHRSHCAMCPSRLTENSWSIPPVGAQGLRPDA